MALRVDKIEHSCPLGSDSKLPDLKTNDVMKKCMADAFSNIEEMRRKLNASIDEIEDDLNKQ